MTILTRGYGQTDRPTDRPTDQPTDIATYRAAITAKNESCLIKCCEQKIRMIAHGASCLCSSKDDNWNGKILKKGKKISLQDLQTIDTYVKNRSLESLSKVTMKRKKRDSSER